MIICILVYESDVIFIIKFDVYSSLFLPDQSILAYC